jgi:propanol-preferring alcohol dehydrogenase
MSTKTLARPQLLRLVRTQMILSGDQPFAQALKLVRRKGTISLVGLPPGEFQTPIFDVVMNRITIRGSIVGGREDLAEAIAFAAEGKVRAQIRKSKLEDVNKVFADMKAGTVNGRAVLVM